MESRPPTAEKLTTKLALGAAATGIFGTETLLTATGSLSENFSVTGNNTVDAVATGVLTAASLAYTLVQRRRLINHHID